MQVDIDIVVYAVIAGVLLGRLWAVLGTRHDDEPQRPNPFTPPPPVASADPSFTTAPVASRMPVVPLPPASLAGGLAQVKAIDNAFDEKQFLQNARDIFSATVGAYAAGNLNAIAAFLSPAVLAQFQQAVNVRQAEGQTAQSRVLRIKESETTAARAEGAQATVAVRFVSDQENILRDAHGTIIGGAEGKAEEVTDIWVFGRDTSVPSSKWVVVETRG